MTTYIPFAPSNIAAPQFMATFDGNQYSIVITWNISSQRYFINVYGLDGTWICTVPLIGTSSGVNITALSYDPTQGVMDATVESPNWRPVGQILSMYIENCQPDVINGAYDCLMITPNTFSFPISADPGQATVLGSASVFMNMIAGYFKQSSLIFRNSMFEVRP